MFVNICTVLRFDKSKTINKKQMNPQPLEYDKIPLFSPPTVRRPRFQIHQLMKKCSRIFYKFIKI